MVRPEEVRRSSRKALEENYKFRTYLKIHADTKDLDRRFLRLHKELFAGYDCRNCCKEYRADFTNKEIEKAAKLLSISGLSLLDSADVCPVVFEMFERLKGEYGFRRHR
ncbi:hypothetical protein [Youngiibacter fragilis]|nr:hypothetical protein [Youngiibacter fragilis]